MRLGRLAAGALAVLTALSGAAWAAESPRRSPLARQPVAAPSPLLARAVDTLPVLKRIDLAGDEKRTRLTLELDRPIEVRGFPLAGPDRLVIEMPDVRFDIDGPLPRAPRGLVQAIRHGKVGKGKARIVLGVSGPVRIDKMAVMDAVEGQPARIVLDLVATDRAAFDQQVRIASAIPVPEPVTVPAEHKRVIVIDPGHGGNDPGARTASGELEKTIVLDFAHRLKERLEASGRYKVVMTRSDDTFVALGERVRRARAANAALFISIHADSIGGIDDSARGATVYTLSDTASDTDAARLAESENKADLLGGVEVIETMPEVTDILLELTHRETKTFSARFARTLVGELRQATRLHANPLRGAAFRVLRAPDVPSVLLELGYMSSPNDLKLLTSEAWRNRTVESVAAAVAAFFEGKTVQVLPPHEAPHPDAETTGSTIVTPSPPEVAVSP